MSIKIRDTILGEKVLICAPVIGCMDDDIIEGVKAIKEKPVDIIEWRADYYKERFNSDKVNGMLRRIRKECGALPVIFTYRTVHEGGESECEGNNFITDDYYFELLKGVACGGYADIIDIEVLAFAEDAVRKLIQYIKEKNSISLASNHHFDKTPSNNEMRKVFKYMHECGADILKLAVMPHSNMDVLRLMEVTAEAAAEYKEPLITMSMGKAGLITRVCGSLTGSAMTFASVSGESAPGQITADTVAGLLDLFGNTKEK